MLEGRNEEFDKADKKRVRLLRHKDKREKQIDGKKYEDSLYDLYLNEHEVFLCYQSEQLVKNFKKVDYIVSFIGEESTTSRFVGVFKNNGILKRLEDWEGEEQAKFDFVELEGFELLKNKLVIDWQGLGRNWCQHYENEMPVIRIDRGFEENNIPIFTRFEDVVLDYNQLKLIFDTNNQEWKSKLESCNCIYLILDKSNGRQYVGSTYNPNGIWGRWEKYAETGHGDDVKLKSLLDEDPAYAKKNFQWCILETLPLKILEEHAIDRESLYKRKFGTREHGNYNNN